jgi:LuxR family maltose regulon positive regulatory protein
LCKIGIQTILARMPDQNQILLQAKLHRPRVTNDHILRSRLFEQLDGGLDCQMTLVSAPAGFGKTTLVSSWLENLAGKQGKESALPSAWLSLDENDSDPGIFLRYWIAALSTIFPDSLPETSILLNTQQPPLNVLSVTLNNEIERLPKKFILVLDDYHLVHSVAVHNLLNELVRHWPRCMHLVLITRNDPPLPLSGLRAKGKINEIRSSDLRFSENETVAYLDQALERPLSQASRKLLQQRNEGWIAGLRLTILSLRTRADPEALLAASGGLDSNIASYLMEEVLSRQLPAVHTFLLKTSILDNFSPSLCEAVAGESDPAWSARACLDWLVRGELFITSLDNDREWFCYHPMFRDLLRQRLLATEKPEGVAELHRRAAAWFTSQSLFDEALRHALKANDLDLADQVIAQGLRDVLNRWDRRTLERWVKLLPEELIQSQPWLLMVHIWDLSFAYQLGPLWNKLMQVEALLDNDGEAKLQPDERQILRGQMIGMKAQQALFLNQPTLCISLSKEALALIPHSWVYLRGAVLLYLCLGMQASGQSQAAERLLLDEYAALDKKTDAYALRLLYTLCFLYFNDGMLEQSRQVAAIMLQQPILGTLPAMQGWAHYFTGAVHYQWNDLAVAQRYFTELVEQRYSVHSICARNGLTGLALIHQIRGHTIQAWRIAELLSQFDLEQVGYEEEATRSLRARLHLMQGDIEKACRWADAFTAPLPDRPLFWIEEPQVTRARILIYRGEDADLLKANQILDAFLELTRGYHNTHFGIEIQALRALALDAQGKRNEALVALQKAVEQAIPGGYVRAFVDQGPRMRGLLTQLAGQRPLTLQIARILSAFPEQTVPLITPSARQASTGDPDLVEHLTRREREILALLREPVSPKEIARQLYLSTATVKRHTITIYSKLGVNSRWDAVSKAIQLGILPPR